MAVAKRTSYATEKLLLLKPRHIFLGFWTLAFVLIALSLGGCGQVSPSKTLLTRSLPAESSSSSAALSKTSNASLYTYMAQEEAIEEPEGPTASVATGSVKLDSKRLITLSGVIDDHTFGLANDLIGLAEKSDDPIDIVISSPGGSVSHGLMFIQAMKEVKKKGVTIRCYVTGMAASMAFNIFTQCDERYSLPYATLLFHAPRVMGTFVIDVQAAKQLYEGLSQLEAILMQLIVPVMGIDRQSGAWFMTSYANERLFLATELAAESPKKWFTVVARIDGYPGSFPAPYANPGGATDKRTARIPSVKEAGR